MKTQCYFPGCKAHKDKWKKEEVGCHWGNMATFLWYYFVVFSSCGRHFPSLLTTRVHKCRCLWRNGKSLHRWRNSTDLLVLLFERLQRKHEYWFYNLSIFHSVQKHNSCNWINLIYHAVLVIIIFNHFL